MADLRDLMRDAYAWKNNATRRAAKEIMNGLAEAGPNWSGEFQDSWVAHSASGGSGGGSYPYALSDIPALPTTKKQVERKTQFIIENVAPHAAIALDLVDLPREAFVFPGQGPQGDIVARGTRPDTGKRGEVESGKGDARSTAPLFWYQLFIRGGKMQKALERGVKLAKPE
jgi:hypothetical protein